MNNHQGFSFEEKQLIRGTVVPYEETKQLENYYPVAICKIDRTIIWRELSNIQFTSSFFSDTLNMQAIEERKVCVTPLSILHDLFPEHQNQDKYEVEDGDANQTQTHFLEPSGFIFHVSRCGSTLLTQMLASLDSCIVMSEPPIMDAAFRFLHANQDFTDKDILIKQLIYALARQRSPKEKHFFIKFDSWHVAWISLIRKIYPQTPIVFLYREPAEVLASHQKQRGPQMIPHYINLSALQPDVNNIPAYDFDAYCLRMQLSFYQTILEQLPQTTLTLVNYTQLPDIVWDKLLGLFSMQLSEVEMQKVIARTSFHSKNQHQSFTKNPAIKSIHPQYKETQKSYQELEKIRLFKV